MENARRNQRSERVPFPDTSSGTPTHRRRAAQTPKGQSLPGLTCHNRCPLGYL